MKKIINNVIFTTNDSNVITLVDKRPDTYVVIDSINDFINDVSKNVKGKLKTIQDKSFYRHPNLKLPRQKVDLLKEKYNIKITRDIKKADYEIISIGFIEKLISYGSFRILNCKEALDLLLKNKSSFTNESYEKFKYFLESKEDEFIGINRWYGASRNIFLSLINAKAEYGYNKIGLNNLKLVEELKTKNVIFDSSLNDFIYEDLHVLTEEEYNNARNMIKSNDADNLNLVMELLSNCNLYKSFDYVSMLFYFYYDVIKYSKNWNSVNVKTLRENLKDFAQAYNNKNKGQYYERYLKKLKEHGQLSEFAIKQCSNYIYHNVIKFHLSLNDDSILTIDKTSIKLKEDQKAYVLTKEN